MLPNRIELRRGDLMGAHDEDPAGWEYKLLDLLPADAQREVWNKAFRQWMKTGKAGVITAVCLVPLSISLSIVWVVAGALGWGFAGKFAAEVIVHLTFAYFLHPVMQRINRQYMRPFLAEELLLFARQGLAQDHEAAIR
jgi:hypothetical protein